MGYSAGSVNKSQYRVRYSTRRNGSVVLSGWNFSEMEVHWLALVDLWQTYVVVTRFRTSSDGYPFSSGVWEEHPLVRLFFTLRYDQLTSRHSSAIIQDIETQCKEGLASIAYFYFDFRDLDKQNCRSLLSSLLVQLSAQSSPRCDILCRLYSEHGKGSRAPSDAALTQCLKDMLTIPNQPPIYIILDALDECPNSYGIPSPREQVLALVKEFMGVHLPHLHICITSRPEFDIRATLGPLALHSVSLHDESGQKKDIIDYVNSVVYSDAETMMKRWREEDKKMVAESLSERADGM
jgi:hypothetical protein